MTYVDMVASKVKPYLKNLIPMSNFLNGKAVNKPITSISQSDENFLKNFKEVFIK